MGDFNACGGTGETMREWMYGNRIKKNYKIIECPTFKEEVDKEKINN